MMLDSQTVEITSVEIRKVLNKYAPERAISEYIWNDFDAKATIIKIDFEFEDQELDTVKEIKVTDNGIGICYEELTFKFKNSMNRKRALSILKIQILQEEKMNTGVSFFISLQDLSDGKHYIKKIMI